MAEVKKLVSVCEHNGSERTARSIGLDSETSCTRVRLGDDQLCLEWLSGRLCYPDLPDEPWPGPIVALKDCAVGDFVYVDGFKTVGAPAQWHRCEVVTDAS